MPRHKQQLGRWPHLAQAGRQLRAPHSGHDNIADQEIDGSGFGGDYQRIRRVAGFQDRVAVGTKPEHGQPTNAVVVLDHQHRLGPAWWRQRNDGLAYRTRYAIRYRQQNGHRGPEPHLAVNPDVPSALLHDAVAGRETQASALSLPLGGEERFEQVGQHVVGHPGSGIGDRQRDVVAGYHLRMSCAVLVAHREIGRFDDQPAAVRHGVPSVDGQVDQELLNLAGIRLDDIQTIA